MQMRSISLLWKLLQLHLDPTYWLHFSLLVSDPTFVRIRFGIFLQCPSSLVQVLPHARTERSILMVNPLSQAIFTKAFDRFFVAATSKLGLQSFRNEVRILVPTMMYEAFVKRALFINFNVPSLVKNA